MDDDVEGHCVFLSLEAAAAVALFFSLAPFLVCFVVLSTLDEGFVSSLVCSCSLHVGVFFFILSSSSLAASSMLMLKKVKN